MEVPTSEIKFLLAIKLQLSHQLIRSEWLHFILE